MKNDMIERYIYAVKKRLPKKMRNDVSQELEELISDMLEERCGELVPNEKDIRVVLAEIGTPDELALKYNPNGERYFMGEPYYSHYILTARITTLVIFCILAVLGLSVCVVLNYMGGLHISDIILCIFLIAVGTFASFGIVTFIFSKKAKIHESNPAPKKTKPKTKEEIEQIIDNLPVAPKKQTVKMMIESIFGIVFSAFFGIVMLFLGFRGANISYFHHPMNILNIDEFVSGSYLIVMITALGITREVIKLKNKRYNFKVLFSSIVTNVLITLSAVIWLSNYKIFNIYLDKAEISYFSYESSIPLIADAYITIFCNNFLTIIIFITTLDIFVTLFRYYKTNFSSPKIQKHTKKPFAFPKLKKA